MDRDSNRFAYVLFAIEMMLTLVILAEFGTTGFIQLLNVLYEC